MANQIAEQFAQLPSDEAAALVAGHLRAFWTPTMRADLLIAIRAGEDGLPHSLVTAAAALLSGPSDRARRSP
jgi:formate dehydrogenase subunit delta